MNEHSEVGADCASGKRNRFFVGKMMGVAEFATEQSYGIARRRLINRAVLGWGVVQGLAVGVEQSDRGASDSGEGGAHGGAPSPAAEGGRIVVSRGLALDRFGREIVLSHAIELDEKNTFVVETLGDGYPAKPLPAPDGRYLLSIHYAEQYAGESVPTDECGCSRLERSAVCETAVLSLTPLCDDHCPCAETGCHRGCPCGKGAACGDADRGPHACLCHWVTDAEVAGDAPPLCGWNGHQIDRSSGVALACVRLGKADDPCAPIIGSVEDACRPRRLVKNNDLLYDLVRGCDLTRIASISWSSWHRAAEPVKWEQFAAMFPAGAESEIATGFTVKFTQPVLKSSIGGDSVTMTVVVTDVQTNWWLPHRAPIVRLDTTPDWPPGAAESDQSDDYTNQLRLIVDAAWVGDEIVGRPSLLAKREGQPSFTVEIEVHGDAIVDCHGQAIDGDAIGTTPTPSGNGTPGGTFRSSFRVCGRSSYRPDQVG